MGKLFIPNSSKSASNYLSCFLFFVIGLSVGVVCSYSYFQTLFFTAAVVTLSSNSDQNSCNNHSLSTSLMHDMSDPELLGLAASTAECKNMVPKVAFMFLTPGPMPLAPLWELFLKGHEGLYSIYVHPHPSYTDSWSTHSVFYRRRIPSKTISWGKISMIDAERRLVGNALLDPSNQRFVLVSDSCIPLFNFTTIYSYLINSHRSFLGSFDEDNESGRGRYNPEMHPEIEIEQWRKGAQWFELRRDLAVVIVSDKKYYDLFRKLCVPRCYSDEHYLPTMVNIVCPELSSNRSVTWVDWSKGGAHPAKYVSAEVSEELLLGIRRRSYCEYNGEANAACFLFARKFMPDTLQQLLRLAPTVMFMVQISNNSFFPSRFFYNSNRKLSV